MPEFWPPIELTQDFISKTGQCSNVDDLRKQLQAFKSNLLLAASHRADHKKRRAKLAADYAKATTVTLEALTKPRDGLLRLYLPMMIDIDVAMKVGLIGAGAVAALAYLRTSSAATKASSGPVIAYGFGTARLSLRKSCASLARRWCGPRGTPSAGTRSCRCWRMTPRFARS
jgi:hypothetical protein